jgi:hypothetical protein
MTSAGSNVSADVTLARLPSSHSQEPMRTTPWWAHCPAMLTGPVTPKSLAYSEAGLEMAAPDRGASRREV